MYNRSYLAILAGGALFAAGAAGCDAGDPETPEPESSAMYDTDEADRATDSMADSRTEAEERLQQAEQQADRSLASPETDRALDSLATIGTEELVGKTVVSQQGEEIGEIEEIVMDNDTQKHLAVVDVGGFLGIGEKSVAVEFDQLELSDDGRVQSDLTRETLQSQPEYDAAQYGKAEDPVE
jgi:hypothetical protein